MKAYTYINKGKFALVDKQKPAIIEPTDAIVRVTGCSDYNTKGVRQLRKSQQRPRRCRQSVGGSRRQGHVPAGLAVCTSQCYRNNRCPIRRGTDFAPARHVRQEPHVQDWRCRRLRL